MTFRSKLSRGLQLDIPYYSVPLPDQGRPASVLALFGSPREQLSDMSLLLTRRTERVETHKGQIAFPGGAQDPEDQDVIETALRETEEEVGIPRSEIEIIGTMPRLWTRTGFLVTPVLGLLKSPIEDRPIEISPAEIDEVFWTPMKQVQDPGTYREDFLEVAGTQYSIHSFQLGSHRVWGVTGSIIKNILDRISSVA